jgi:hypothetical protein
VSTQTLLPRHHYKPYHHQGHLLYQFILSEMILAYNELQMVQAMQEQGLSIEKFTSCLQHLAGSAQDYMRLFTWSDDSILAKLKSYSDLFLSYGEEKATDLHVEINKIWLLSMQVMAIIKSHNHDSTLLNNLLNKMHRSFKRMASIASQIALDYKRNENVILFLIRNHEQTDKMFGNKFTAKLLKKMFPKGINEALHFLTEKYSERGFEHILPLMHSKLKQLSER